MAMVAMWFEETDAISSGNAKLLMIFIGLVAVSMLAQAIVVIAIAVKAAKTATRLTAMAEDLKAKLLPLVDSKVLPLVDSVMKVTQATQALLHDTAPKVALITDNLVETSKLVRGSAQQFDKTLTDANLRTQRQVARIDGMVTAALTTTAQVVETIDHGIRVPAQKIAVVATQVRYGLEGLLAKVKSMATGKPFGTP